MGKLSAVERKLLTTVERGEWRRVPGEARLKARLQRMAAGHLRKAERINVRLSPEDLEGLRRRASEEGLPYQTLITSLLHKYVAGRLVERPARG